ncbi:hypothetical protein TYRP_006010 [Tyrophagus putrescentiae]|nr:hypothetical protein TYRP_006010 [Tyrophagus putrescentiae]
MDEFYSATTTKEQKPILAKKTDLKKCSGRYKANLLSTALRVLRYNGGADEAGTLKSPYFTKVYEIFQLNSDIYTFMEHISGKSLYNRIVDKEPTTAVQHRKWTIQLLQAIHKLQDVGVAHRQLTVHQVLFTASDQKPERRARANSHLPPDCFRRSAYDPSKVDIWSIGVLMVAMETVRLPFDVSAPFKISAQWRQFVTVHEMNRLLRIACNQVFWIDPKRRATVDELLKSPYFSAPDAKISEKALKKTVDPKHHPELFEGADPSVTMSNLGCNPPSSSGSAAGSSASSKARSGSKTGSAHSSSAGAGPPKASKVLHCRLWIVERWQFGGFSLSKQLLIFCIFRLLGLAQWILCFAQWIVLRRLVGQLIFSRLWKLLRLLGRLWLGSSSSSAGSSSSSASSGATEESLSDAATGNEGGSVAESGSKTESQASVNSAKEESAESGKPVSVSHKSILSASSGHSSSSAGGGGGSSSGGHSSSAGGSRSGSKTSSSSH